MNNIFLQASTQHGHWTFKPDMGFVFIALIVIATLLYFMPSFIAFTREHSSKWIILLINLLFGISGVGWIVTLIWALNDRKHQQIIINNQIPQQNYEHINLDSFGGKSLNDWYAQSDKRDLITISIDPTIENNIEETVINAKLQLLYDLLVANKISLDEYEVQKRKITSV